MNKPNQNLDANLDMRLRDDNLLSGEKGFFGKIQILFK